MRLFLAGILMCMMPIAGISQSTAVASDPLKFKELIHDFQSIQQGKPVFYTFEFENMGKDPLILENVQATCGCTTPEWKKEPVAPGAKGVIKVGFNAAVASTFEKHINVTYNGGKLQSLIIKGTVWQVPVGAAPINEPVKFLQQIF